MKETYLEVTFRHGKAIAAYYYLPRRPGQKSYKSVPIGSGLVVDFGHRGKPIGIEITAPTKITLAALNQALSSAHQEPATPDDFAPLNSIQPPTSASR